MGRSLGLQITTNGTRDWLRRVPSLTLYDDEGVGTYRELEKRYARNPFDLRYDAPDASPVCRLGDGGAETYRALAGLPVSDRYPDLSLWNAARPVPPGLDSKAEISDPVAAALTGRLLTWSHDLDAADWEPIWASDADEVAASLDLLRDHVASTAAQAWSDRVRYLVGRYVAFYSSLRPGEEVVAEDA